MKKLISLAAILATLAPYSATAAIIIQDDFTGTVIDGAKWTETDPGTVISQNGNLRVDASHAGTITIFTDNLQSVASVSSGTAVAQSSMTWTDPGGNEALQSFTLYINSLNYARIVSRSGGGTYRLIITNNGSTIYDAEPGISNATDVKITYDITGKDIKFWYWNGSWTQMGTTQNSNIGTTAYAMYTLVDSATFANADQGQYDNFYLSDADYATQFPSAAAPAAASTISDLVFFE